MYKSSRVASRSRLLGHLDDIPAGAFSIFDWTDYPAGVPKPRGPFRIVEGQVYEAALTAKNNANRALHKAHPEWKGKQIHEIHPVKLGGSPTDLSNKIVLDPVTHAQASGFWQRKVNDAERGR